MAAVDPWKWKSAGHWHVPWPLAQMGHLPGKTLVGNFPHPKAAMELGMKRRKHPKSCWGCFGYAIYIYIRICMNFFLQSILLWVKQCHENYPPVITIFIGGIHLPFPVMGGLYNYCFTHISPSTQAVPNFYGGPDRRETPQTRSWLWFYMNSTSLKRTHLWFNISLYYIYNYHHIAYHLNTIFF